GWRRADLGRDHGEEARVGVVGSFGLVARFGERSLARRTVSDVAAHALDLGPLGAAHCGLAPGDPAHALRGVEALVMDPRAVRQDRRFALLGDRQRELRAEQRITRLA